MIIIKQIRDKQFVTDSGLINFFFFFLSKAIPVAATSKVPIAIKFVLSPVATPGLVGFYWIIGFSGFAGLSGSTGLTSNLSIALLIASTAALISS